MKVRIEWDWRFFALLPALNLNLHSRSFEFEWLFLGVYCDTTDSAGVTK